MGQLNHAESTAQSSATATQSDRSALLGALEILAQELVRWSADDPKLRSALHDVALYVASSTSSSQLATAAQQQLSLHAGSDTSTDCEPQGGAHCDRPEGNRESRAGQHAAEDCDNKPRYSDVSDGDIPLIVQRCRLKAEGTRWAVERDEMLREGADFAAEVRPVDAEIIEQAKALPNCFLWMNQPRNDTWTRADDYLLVADCFDTLADTLDSMQVAMETGNAEQFMEAVLLVAEAQSAVRCAVAQVETHADSDQQQTYHWLRNRASQDRFYISRFMRISDPADPEECDDVSQRAQKLKSAIESSSPTEEAGSQSLRVRLKLLAGLLSSQDSEDWDEAIEAMDGICSEDYQPVLPELCQLLLPFEAELKTLELPAPVARLVAEVASQGHGEGTEGQAADAA